MRTTIFTAATAMALLRFSVVEGSMTYRPPRRSRRAADDPRFQTAKETADASDGTEILCKMNLIVEMDYSTVDASSASAVLCENENRAGPDLFFPADTTELNADAGIVANRWISLNLSSIPPKIVSPQARIGARRKPKMPSVKESDRVKIIDLDALELAKVVIDEPMHIPPSTPRSSKTGSPDGMGMGMGMSMGMSKRSKRERRGNAAVDDVQTPAEQISDEGTLPAEQVVGHGDRDVLIMRVVYAGHEPSYCDEQCVRTNMWTGTPSVDSLYHQVSFGKVRFPESMGNVITVNVPNGPHVNTACKFWEIGLEADDAARAIGIEPNDFSHRAYVLPQDIGGCTFGGLGYVGCSSTYCKTWIRQPAGGTLAHELGHNLGVWHSALDGNNDGVQDNEYGDNSDIMGSSTNWRGMNSAHRMVLNWLPQSSVIEYAETDLICAESVTKTLISLSRAVEPSTGPSVISLPRLAPGRGTYYISLRTASGVDESLTSSWQNKVFIHYHATHSTRYQVNTQLVRALGSGESFHEDTTGFTLTVGGINTKQNSATVTYHFCENGETPGDASPSVPPDVTTIPTPVCTDTAPDKCAIWRDSGFCAEGGIYFNYMSINCKSACGLCPTNDVSTTRSSKDGFMVDSFDDSQARENCVDLTPYQTMPSCVPGGVPCCEGSICAPVGANTPNGPDYRCVVPRGTRKADGEKCTFHANCIGTCDKTTWTCTSEGSRSRRSASSANPTFMSTSSIMDQMPITLLTAFCVFGLTLGVAVGIHHLRRASTDTSDIVILASKTARSPTPTEVDAPSTSSTSSRLRPRTSVAFPILAARSKSNIAVSTGL